MYFIKIRIIIFQSLD